MLECLEYWTNWTLLVQYAELRKSDKVYLIYKDKDMKIRLILAKTKFKEVAVEVPEGTTRKEVNIFAGQQFPDYDVVDVIYPDDEDYNLPLDNA